MSESKNSKKEIIITSNKEGIKTFEDAIEEEFHKQMEQELWLSGHRENLYDEFGNKKRMETKDVIYQDSEEYNEAKQASDYEPISKAKIRKKNTHLIPKKKKRKK